MAERPSAALDAREKTPERLSQFFVGDLGHGRGQLERSRRIVSPTRLLGAAAQRRLSECEPLNGAPAEKTIDALADHRA
jgi:hypothetical protein